SLRRQSNLLLSKGGVFQWLHQVAGYFFRVPKMEAAVRQDRMIPSLALQGLKSSDLLLTLRIGSQQNRLAAFGYYEKKRLVRQKNHLTPAKASFLPVPFAVRQIKATENADIKAIGVSFVHHKVRKFGLELLGHPKLGNLPPVTVFADLKQGNAGAIQACHR